MLVELLIDIITINAISALRTHIHQKIVLLVKDVLIVQLVLLRQQ